jgi:death-on-curing protein
MNEPIWVLKKVVLAIHVEQISEHGGEEGIRDEGLLDSALSRPQNYYFYKKSDLFELAANYAYGIIQNHPFIDGNKRTAFVTSVLFLALNNYDIKASRQEKVMMFINLADKKIRESELASWFRTRCASFRE